MATTKLEACPFCGKREARRYAHGDGFGTEILAYVGEVRCKCGAMMQARLKAVPGEDGYKAARALVTAKWNKRVESESKAELLTHNEVAEILADLFGDTCACNFNDISYWLPDHCDFRETACPEPVGVACWEQYLKHRKYEEKMKGCEDGFGNGPQTATGAPTIDSEASGHQPTTPKRPARPRGHTRAK